jgi:hypothetical protein
MKRGFGSPVKEGIYVCKDVRRKAPHILTFLEIPKFLFKWLSLITALRAQTQAKKNFESVASQRF